VFFLPDGLIQVHEDCAKDLVEIGCGFWMCVIANDDFARSYRDVPDLRVRKTRGRFLRMKRALGRAAI
jgi:hypothetical protein